MDQKTLRERRLRKKRQMMIRKYTRLGIIAAAVILLGVFLIRGIVLPLVGGKDADSTELRGTVAMADNTFTGDFLQDGSEAEGSAQEELVDSEPPEETAQSDTGTSSAGSSSGVTTEAQGNIYAAVRMPLKGAADITKITDRLPGWHESDEGKWYQNTDGTYYVSGFQQIDGVQYSFDDSGYVQTGWISSGVNDYYFNEDGSYNPDKTKPMLALTFDDGPSRFTETLLECLKENGAHATFFELGECIEYYPDVPGKILEAGCELGNHSYDHKDVMTLYNAGDYDAAVKEFTDTDDKLLEVCGHASTVARAPYGSGCYDLYEMVGKPFFMWSLDSLDWSYMDEELDYQAVMQGDLTDGTVILMHDIHEPTIHAALRIIPELVSMGYKLVTLSEMAEAKGVVLQNTSYSDFWQSSLDAGIVKGYTGESGLLSQLQTQTVDDSVSDGSSNEDSYDEVSDGSSDEYLDDGSSDEDY